MQEVKRICLAEVREYYKDELVKSYNDFYFSKEAAVSFCTDIVRKRVKEIKSIELVTPGALLGFMNDEETRFKLCVSEYSVARKVYEKADGYQKEFHELISDCKSDLYDQLLSIVICNNYFYDYFGNVMDVYTDPQMYVGYWEGAFSEEDCTEGIYRGSLYYYEPRDKTRINPFTANSRWYFVSAWMSKEQVEDEDGDRDTYVAYLCMENELEDAVKYSCGSLLREMCRYYIDEEGFVADLTEEQEFEVFNEKVQDYSVKISAISSNCIQFDSQEELAKYYAEQVANNVLTEESMYDFLLSLVKCEERYYDIHGRLLRSRIVRHELDGTTEYDIIPDFSMESARDVFRNQEKRKEDIDGV